MKSQRFWEVDLLLLCKQWLSDLSTFLMTLVMFLFLSLPVVIPTLVMWYLSAINWRASS
ncbi:MAG: hypothetical protein ACI9I0_001472 [Rhodoferax sp.]|jgi:hypothetical protein